MKAAAKVRHCTATLEKKFLLALFYLFKIDQEETLFSSERIGTAFISPMVLVNKCFKAMLQHHDKKLFSRLIVHLYAFLRHYELILIDKAYKRKQQAEELCH